MNDMANVRLNAYVKGVGNIMKKHTQSAKEGLTGKKSAKSGLGAGGGCLR